MHYSHDISLSYNISLIYRTVDDKLEASEDFLGMMEMASCNAKSMSPASRTYYCGSTYHLPIAAGNAMMAQV